jgi:hypothetical protein
MWLLLRGATASRWRLPIALTVLSAASFALCIWLMKTDRSATAFFMSPPRAWEFLIGGIVAVEGFPQPRNAMLRRAARGIALAMLAIPVFSLRQGPGFPGFNALLPCIGAALFIWSGIGVPTLARNVFSPLEITRFFGRISYSLYLWHWPLFTFARFSKTSLTLGPFDKIALFALTVAISWLSWRLVEQPFRRGRLVPTRRAAFRIAGASTALLLAASVAGIVFSTGATEADRTAQRLEAYDNYSYQTLYRYGSCFVQNFAAFDDKCLAMVPGKTNVLLWGDSLAAHYSHGLEKALDPQATNILQATQAACMPTLAVAAQGLATCRLFAARMETFFAGNKPDLVILSADWGEYARGSRFDGMIADLRQTVARVTAAGMRVVLLGPPVQFRSRLPSMLLRADDFVLPDIFALDARMREALPSRDGFTYVSVVNALCPARQCPLTVEDDIPLAWDHAHLTAEGSEYVIGRLAGVLGPVK